MIPIGTLLQLKERDHTYRIIVLSYFPVFFNDEQIWHYELNFFRDDVNLGSLAFDEIELNKLINSGEVVILSRGKDEDI